VNAEIVGVGTEILLGQIGNDDAQWMSERLAEIGVDVIHHHAGGDNEARIAEVLSLARPRAVVALVTGRLWPTQADSTLADQAPGPGIRLVGRPDQ